MIFMLGAVWCWEIQAHFISLASCISDDYMVSGSWWIVRLLHDGVLVAVCQMLRHTNGLKEVGCLMKDA